jgi:hypothetical protein
VAIAREFRPTGPIRHPIVEGLEIAGHPFV